MAPNVLNLNIKLKKFIPRFIYGVVFFIVALLFVENFVFSESISILQFREIDDLAFQQVLRDAHLKLQRGNLFDLLKLTNYAYGWIYWAPLVAITYPAFLLSQKFSIDWLLIVIPRDFSLMFAVLSMVYIRKILKVYAAPEWLCSIGVLIYALFPTTGYFSLRFGTVSEVAFFSVLTIYLCVKNQAMSSSDVKHVVLGLAFTGAVKLSGLLIAPLVIYFVLVRSKLTINEFIKNSLMFFLLLAVFTYPLLLVAPFKWSIAKDYLGMMNHFIEITRLFTGQQSIVDKIYSGICGNLYCAITFLSLFMGIIIAGWQSKTHRHDFFAMGCMLLFSLLYLSLTVGSSSSISSYFTSVSYLLIFGILGLYYFHKLRIALFILPIVMLVSIAQTAIEGLNRNSSGFSMFPYYIKSANSTESLDLADSIEDCIQSNGGYKPRGHVFKDYSIQLLINTINNPELCISNAWNDLNPARISCARRIDYIIIDMVNPIALRSQSEFNQQVNNSDSITADNLRTDRRNRGLLISKGNFGVESFSKVCELKGAQVYKNNEDNFHN